MKSKPVSLTSGCDGLAMEEPDITVYPDREMVGQYAGRLHGRRESRPDASTYLDRNAEEEYWEE